MNILKYIPKYIILLPLRNLSLIHLSQFFNQYKSFLIRAKWDETQESNPKSTVNCLHESTYLTLILIYQCMILILLPTYFLPLNNPNGNHCSYIPYNHVK